MNKIELARETRKQRRLEALGTNEPRCGTCGERDWRCIELHHPSDHARDETTVLTCRNCHRKNSDRQKDHPQFNPNADRALDNIGHFLLGVADMLEIIFERLYAFGLILIERAALPQSGDVK